MILDALDSRLGLTDMMINQLSKYDHPLERLSRELGTVEHAMKRQLMRLALP